MCEKPFFENLGGHHCRHFAKKEFSKVKHVKLFLVKLTSILGQDITTEKKTTFFHLRRFYRQYLFKQNPEEKTYE